MSKSLTSEFNSSAGVVMIRVPAGSFMMGSLESEDGHRAWEPRREVTFASDFYLGKTPVTQDQFEAVTGTNPTVHEKIGDAPVDSVNWEQSNEYCQKLTKLDRHAGVLPDPIYDAIRANDFDWALRIVTADPDAVESPEGIPPPLDYCGDEDKPEWVEWLVDHGADIERLNQEYGSTALTCAVIRRQKRIIRTLVKRGANSTDAMDCAQRGLAGAYEDDPDLDREGYREIIELLRELGIGSRQ